MNLSPQLRKRYTRDTLSAPEAQRLAEFIAFGPVIFQTARIMDRTGILGMLRDSKEGMTVGEVARAAGLTHYAAQCLLEASLSIGIVKVDDTADRFTLSKAGWFLATDAATRVNISFNHDINYRGWYHLEESLRESRPAGLATLGSWPTIYEGLTVLPDEVRGSWFDFDHFYSDSSFDEALDIVFATKPRTLLDVGGNTGRWALRCVARDSDVNVTVVDLPRQIALMSKNIADAPGARRIRGFAADMLDPAAGMPPEERFDAVWMSQFLDCFSEEQVHSILLKAAGAMGPGSRLYIMETLWDRQRYETAAMCLTLTSLYFTAMANGNSKMFHSDDLLRLINGAGLRVEAIHDHLGQGHSIIVCRLDTAT